MNRTCFRRGLALLLSLTLCVSLSAPALAEDTSGTGDGAVALTGISVSLSYSQLSLWATNGSLTATVTAQPEGAVLPDGVSCSWASDDTGVAAVSPAETAATVSAQDPGTATAAVSISAEGVGTASVTCTASVTADGQTYTADAAPPCTVTVPGLTLSQNSLSLHTRDSAVLTANVYGDIGDVTWSSGNDSVATVSDSGTVTAAGAGSTSITVTAGDYTASCTVTVSEVTADVITADADVGSPLSFSDLDSSLDSQCQKVLGHSLSYVTGLSVPTSAGTLYYGFVSEAQPGAGVGSSEKYDVSGALGGRSLDDVTFVPKGDFSGNAIIQYTGYDAYGDFFNGTIRVGVEATSVIHYSTVGQNQVDFQISDFSAVCQDKTGHGLQSVSFSLPSSSKGTLYYHYSGSSLDNKVSEDTPYYPSKNPYLSEVSFVPASDYAGTVTIDYEGVDTSGNSYSGRVEIAVSSSGGGSGNITYSTTENKAISFDVDDFDDLCENETDYHLSYVRFTLPSSSKGTLYYNYTSSGDYDSKVSSSRNYYRSSSPYLDSVSFVPASNWTGTVDLDFTAHSTDGDSFSGTVEVTVKGTSSDTISYSTTENKAVSFDVDDFDDLCENETDYHLSYVRFTLPSSSKGTLYYNYTSSGDYDSKVSSSRNYYRSSSPYLDSVSFVPASNWTGTVDIDFTAHSTDGDSFSGTVEVTVAASIPVVTNSFTDMAGYAWASPSVEYLYDGGIVYGTGSGKFSPGAPLIRGDFMLMLCRAFSLAGSGGAGFSDVPSGSYYDSAIRTTQALGIAQGSGGQFYPTRALSREEAAVFLLRALRADGWTIADGSSSSLASFSDRGAVSPYAVGAVSAMVQLGILQGDGSGRLAPQSTLTRAEMAVIFYRAMNL